MKKSILILAIILISTVGLFAQNIPKQYPPEKVPAIVASDNLFFYFDFKTNTYIPLAKTTATITSKHNRVRPTTIDYYLNVGTAQSKFLVPRNDTLTYFYIKSKTEPLFALYMLQKTGENWSALGWSQPFQQLPGISWQDGPEAAFVSLTENIYQVTPLVQDGMPPGEYCFANNWDFNKNTVDIYRFAIK